MRDNRKNRLIQNFDFFLQSVSKVAKDTSITKSWHEVMQAFH
jgi:hypothetical protein